MEIALTEQIGLDKKDDDDDDYEYGAKGGDGGDGHSQTVH